MTRLRFRRRPSLYIAATVIVLLFNFYLCYPAGVSRGYPSIRPFDLVAIFLAPAAMILPPFFDDSRNSFRARLRRAVCVAAPFSFIWGIVLTNLSDAVPHTGHLAGVKGVLSYLPIHVLTWTIFCFLPAVVFFFSFESVAIRFWSLLRELDDRSNHLPEQQHRKALH